MVRDKCQGEDKIKATSKGEGQVQGKGESTQQSHFVCKGTYASVPPILTLFLHAYALYNSSLTLRKHTYASVFIATTFENQSQTLGKYTQTIVIFTRKQFFLHVYVICSHVSVVLSCRKHAKLSGRGIFSAVYACLQSTDVRVFQRKGDFAIRKHQISCGHI